MTPGIRPSTITTNKVFTGVSINMAEKNNKVSGRILKRPEHLSLVDIAYNALSEAIINQEFQPGEPLSIDHLVRQLNMSNTPVREALMRLNGERLVKQKTNHGFVVTELLTPMELHQLFTVRHLLEIHALESATLAPEAIDVISQLVDQMLRAGDGSAYHDYKDYLQLDRQFHRSLVALSGNNFLVKAWEDLHIHLHLSRLYSGVGLFDRTDSAREHQAILKALQTGDKIQVINLLNNHIKGVEHRLEKFLDR
ncbi:MAG TPA: GntR family transcriptional regulator [Phototrophicaceae bacterium]|jgi:DNA-binding GntR family transcriptional regulator|nr:GntR family transcriptional regulator [Phototrophicaceae bacterium]